MITAKITIAQPIRVNASGISTRGARGKSTYELYLETTTDNPPMTEAQFVDSKAVLEQTTGQSTTHGMSQKAITDALDSKVDKVTGKSLISDTEITRLAGVTNQTLSGLGGEPSINKKTTINATSDVEFPTSKAVATALAAKTDDATLQASMIAAAPVIPYRSRVLADSGVVNDISALTKLYVENLKLLDNTVFLLSSDAGMKTRTSGVNLFGTKLYDLVSATQDLAQATEASQPHIGGTIAPSEVRKLKGLTGETGTKGFTGTNITKLATASWSLSIMLKWNAPRSSSRIYLSASNYILLTPTTITLVGDAVNVLVCTNTLAAGINNMIQFEYSNGAGLIRVNGVEIATTVLSGAVTFGSLFLNQTSYNFDGEIHYLQIFNKRLSAIEAQANYTLWRNRIPKIEGIAIGNQFWATSNAEVAVDNTGAPISEIQADGNGANVITNGGFDTDTDWVKYGESVIEDGVGKILSTDGSLSGLRQLDTVTANMWYKVDFLIQNMSSGSGYFAIGSDSAGINRFIFASNNTYSVYLKAGSLNRTCYIMRNTATSFEIDNISIVPVGWSGLQAMYDGLIAQGQTVAQAAQACQAWCYYNNLPENGAVYGKEYNWWATANLAPAGYRVPTADDYTQLANYLGGTAVAGGKMKKEGLTYWDNTNTGATNESGFSTIAGGYRHASGSFLGIRTESRNYYKQGRVFLSRDNAELNFLNYADGAAALAFGQSVRFLRNEPVGDNERNIETGYITNALGATNLDISIPFGYQVESIRFDSETNITGLSAKLLTGALVELETLFTAKAVTANVQKVIAADADQSIQQTDAVVRINGTKTDTTKRFRVWIKLTKVVFS